MRREKELRDATDDFVNMVSHVTESDQAEIFYFPPSRSVYLSSGAALQPTNTHCHRIVAETAA